MRFFTSYKLDARAKKEHKNEREKMNLRIRFFQFELCLSLFKRIDVKSYSKTFNLLLLFGLDVVYLMLI